MKFLLTALMLLLTISLGFAQPEQRRFNGCHHAHNNVKRSEPLTIQELEIIEETIARSDTFDVLRYTINLDVSDYGSYSIAAATTIQFAARMNNLQSIRFDLYNLIVDSVHWENASTLFIIMAILIKIRYGEGFIFRPITSTT